MVAGHCGWPKEAIFCLQCVTSLSFSEGLKYDYYTEWRYKTAVCHMHLSVVLLHETRRAIQIFTACMAPARKLSLVDRRHIKHPGQAKIDVAIICKYDGQFCVCEIVRKKHVLRNPLHDQLVWIISNREVCEEVRALHL